MMSYVRSCSPLYSHALCNAQALLRGFNLCTFYQKASRIAKGYPACFLRKSSEKVCDFTPLSARQIGICLLPCNNDGLVKPCFFGKQPNYFFATIGGKKFR